MSKFHAYPVPLINEKSHMPQILHKTPNIPVSATKEGFILVCCVMGIFRQKYIHLCVYDVERTTRLKNLTSQVSVWVNYMQFYQFQDYSSGVERRTKNFHLDIDLLHFYTM
jgi:hypothetical protein